MCPAVFLSPSTQEYNPYITGNGSEEYFTNKIADAMEPYLTAAGISYGRNNPEGTVRDSVALSNAGQYGLHLAIHSNAAPESLAGQLRGTEIYYYPGSISGRRAASRIAENYAALYPEPARINVIPRATLYELRSTRAPAVLIELAYHDNPADAAFIENNIEEIAENLALSVIGFLK